MMATTTAWLVLHAGCLFKLVASAQALRMLGNAIISGREARAHYHPAVLLPTAQKMAGL
jgi:hypothetical protein